MITFSSVGSPEKQSLEIPKQKNSSFIYNVHINKKTIGRTHGSAFGYIDIYFPNKIARRYKIEDLKKIQKRSLSFDAFVSFGTPLTK